jgi:hypothetical protein
VKDKINKDKDAVGQVEYILQKASHRPGCILKNKTDVLISGYIRTTEILALAAYIGHRK